jgi:hydroxymethylpyrimidine/phosphomethylpyrimidine kinase
MTQDAAFVPRLEAGARPMTTHTSPPPDSASGTDMAADAEDAFAPVCVLVFNASDPSGAGGLTADIATIASVGGHPVAVVTGAYARDTAEIFDHYAFDDEAVAEQARAVLEDMPVQAIKVGFAGSPENLSAIAEVASDYADVPVIAYMPNLSWWRDDLIDQYLDAFQELLLPQTSVLVGNYSTLRRWLLPDWGNERAPSARDLAMAASAMGVPYVLVTGIPAPEQFIDNVLASPQAVLSSARFERFEATFAGAGETLSAALTALVASGDDLAEATAEALSYLDSCLDAGFRPGMGHVLPDRMFWAQPDDDDDGPSDDEPPQDPTATDGFVMPPHDTQH